MSHHNDAYCTFVSAMDDTHRRAAHAALRHERHERLALQQGPAEADRYEPLPTPARGWTPRLVPAMTAAMAVVATALATVAGLIQDRMA